MTISTPIGGGEGFSTYEADVLSATPKGNSIDIMLEVQSEALGYADVLPSNYVTSYFVHTTSVNATGVQAPVAIMKATTPTTITTGQTVSFDASASTGSAPLTYSWDFNGDGIYGDAYTGTPDKPTHEFDSNGTFNVTVKVTNSKGSDISAPVSVQVESDLPTLMSTPIIRAEGRLATTNSACHSSFCWFWTFNSATRTALAASISFWVRNSVGASSKTSSPRAISEP